MAQQSYDVNNAINKGKDMDDGVEYSWQINLDFDMEKEEFYLKIVETKSKRKWTKTFHKGNVNGNIRAEYRSLGEAIQNGTQEYVYPKDSGAVKVTITYQNQ